MKKTFLISVFLIIALCLVNNNKFGSFAQNCDNDFGPKRLVIIKGKVTITNHPELGETPHSGGIVVFQKVGCESCYIGANADIDGKYEILVGDGKYEIIVRNPSSPEFDMLIPEQERFIDTKGENSSKRVFDFDIKIRLPK